MKKIKKQFGVNIKAIDKARNFVNQAYGLQTGNNINLICEKLCNNVPGAYVECGVFRGNTFFAVAEFIKRNKINCDMYGFDTFDGFPSGFDKKDLPERFNELFSNGLIDKEHYKKAAKRTDEFTKLDHLGKEYFEPKFDDVLNINSKYNFSNLIKGKFTDTLVNFNKDISVLFIDCDLYRSYLECFVLYENVVCGGSIVFDEYYSLKYPGALIAVHEFF